MLRPPGALWGPPTAPGADVEERSAPEGPPPVAGAPGALARAARARRPNSLMICVEHTDPAMRQMLGNDFMHAG